MAGEDEFRRALMRQIDIGRHCALGLDATHQDRQHLERMLDRIGGGGAPFNLGEITVTRCTVRSAGGQIGHAYVTGRDGRHAELAALVDAMMQDPSRADTLERMVVAPLEAAEFARRAAIAAKAAATKVRFFAMRNMRT